MVDNITIVWSFRNRLELLKRSILTADRTTPKEVNFLLIDANSDDETIKELRVFISKIENRKIRVCETDYRSSLSEAWNLGIMLTDSGHIIFSSSDVEFIDDRWFNQIKKGINEDIKYLLIENHAVFYINKSIVPLVGWFDENFKPGPHFDVDYMIRASEKGVSVHCWSSGGSYKHGHDDVELESNRMSISDNDDRVKDRLPMNDLYNENYFKEKWDTSWGGWRSGHPPTHISNVRRLKPETDPHPLYTKKYL